MTTKSKLACNIFLILIFSVIIRLFVGEPCKVLSNSMKPSFSSGDWLWINKSCYGSRMPQRFSDIPVLNIFTWIKPLKEYDSQIKLPYYRIWGSEKPKRMDIVIFNDIDHSEKILVKRIIGVPGDSLRHNRKILYLNGIFLSNLDEEKEFHNMNIFIFHENPDTDIIIPENYYFVLGDNRSKSIDSRQFGFVPEHNIIGKVSLIISSNSIVSP